MPEPESPVGSDASQLLHQHRGIHFLRLRQIFNPRLPEKILPVRFRFLQRHCRAEGFLFVPKSHGNTGLANHSRNNPFIKGAAQLGLHTARPSALSADHNPVGIAAEGPDIFMNPVKRQRLILEAEIGNHFSLRCPGRNFRMGQKTEQAQPVADHNHNDAPPGHPLRIKFHLVAIAVLQAASMDVAEYGQVFIRSSRG